MAHLERGEELGQLLDEVGRELGPQRLGLLLPMNTTQHSIRACGKGKMGGRRGQTRTSASFLLFPLAPLGAGWAALFAQASSRQIRAAWRSSSASSCLFSG